MVAKSFLEYKQKLYKLLNSLILKMPMQYGGQVKPGTYKAKPRKGVQVTKKTIDWVNVFLFALLALVIILFIWGK